MLGFDENISKDLAVKTEGLNMADLEELFTLITLFDFPIPDALSRITTPHEKINFLINPKKQNKIGI